MGAARTEREGALQNIEESTFFLDEGGERRSHPNFLQYEEKSGVFSVQAREGSVN